MSKNLFNQNTFSSKNVINSDDVPVPDDLNTIDITTINLTATNITNTELQNATSNTSNNTSAINSNSNSISSNANNINTANSNITNINNTISGLNTSLANISNKVTANEGDITDLENDKQDELSAGTNIAISGSNVISSTNTTYSAQTNGSLSLSGSNQFSINYTNTNSSITLPQQVIITDDTVSQLIVKATSSLGIDARIGIRGARNASTSNNPAQLDFENFDNDLSSVNKLGSIHSRVSNASSNIGGLLISNYVNGSTRTGALNMSNSGNFSMGGGDTFQDVYKLKIAGGIYTSGLSYIKPQLRMFGYDKDNINNSNWGNGSSNNNIKFDRRIGESFCSTTSGIITISKTGYYRIKLSAQTQSDGYNNRVSFMNYLRIVSGSSVTDYSENESRNFFGWVYIRNNTMGGHGSVTFEDCIFLNPGNTIQPRNKLETTSDRNFNNTLSASLLDNYLNIEIERIYDSNPEE